MILKKKSCTKRISYFSRDVRVRATDLPFISIIHIWALCPSEQRINLVNEEASAFRPSATAG